MTIQKLASAPLQTPVMSGDATHKQWNDWYSTISGGFNKIIESLPPTGSILFGATATGRAGWLDIDDGTIGSASSGATNFANQDAFDLYVFLWNTYSDAACAVSTGRGASAKADFLANKTIALPKLLSRTIAVAGQGSGLTSRTNGQTLGEETHVLTGSELTVHHHAHDHTHTYSDKDFGSTINSSQPFVLTVTDVNAGTTGTDIQVTTTTAATGIANTVDLSTTGNVTSGPSTVDTSDVGNSQPFTQFQPTVFLPAIIKL